MIIAAYVVVIALVIAPQLLFSVLYWKWIPAWTKNSYGRLAQFDSWAQVLLLVNLLLFSTGWSDLPLGDKRVILSICLVPSVFIGILKLILLKRAVDSSRVDPPVKEEGSK